MWQNEENDASLKKNSPCFNHSYYNFNSAKVHINWYGFWRDRNKNCFSWDDDHDYTWISHLRSTDKNEKEKNDKYPSYKLTNLGA